MLHYIIKSSFEASSFEIDEFPNQPLKKFNNNFGKIILLFQTVFETEAKSPLSTVQLDFGWIFEMSESNITSSRGSFKDIWKLVYKNVFECH